MRTRGDDGWRPYLQGQVVGQLGQQQRERLEVDAAAVHDALLGAAAVAGAGGAGAGPPSLRAALGEVAVGGAAQGQQRREPQQIGRAHV